MRTIAISILFIFLSQMDVHASLNGIPRWQVPDCAGVNIHFVEPQENELNMIKDAGFGMIRMDFVWSRVEKKKGEYDFGGYQRLTKALHERDITPLYILDYSHSLYEKNRSVVTEEGRKAFARFAAEAVKAISSDNVIWEIWNEPNLDHFWEDQPSVDDYTKLVEASAKAMREVDEDCTIVAPATSRIPMDFLEACFKKGMLKWIDAVSVHPYREKPPETVLEEYTALKQLIYKYSDGKFHPILSGEWGYSIHPYRGLKVDEHMQAQFIVRQFLTNFLAGVRVSIWYDWHDDGPDPKEREHNFGTVFHDFEPKETYKAAKVFNHQLKNMRFLRRYKAIEDNVYLLLFGHREKKVLVAWTTGEEQDYPFKRLQVKHKAITMLGGTIELAKDDSGVVLPLSGDPIYVPVVSDDDE